MKLKIHLVFSEMTNYQEQLWPSLSNWSSFISIIIMSKNRNHRPNYNYCQRTKKLLIVKAHWYWRKNKILFYRVTGSFTCQEKISSKLLGSFSNIGHPSEMQAATGVNHIVITIKPTLTLERRATRKVWIPFQTSPSNCLNHLKVPYLKFSNLAHQKKRCTIRYGTNGGFIRWRYFQSLSI